MPVRHGASPKTPPSRSAQTPAPPVRCSTSYEAGGPHDFDDLLDFHVRFERIHPFQDGNGRVGRLILLKECLRWGIVPFIITDELKLFYYRGLAHWDEEREWLRDTCLTAQDAMREVLERLRVDATAS